MLSASKTFWLTKFAPRIAFRCFSSGDLLVNDSSYSWLKDDLNLNTDNHGVFNGSWGGTGNVWALLLLCIAHEYVYLGHTLLQGNILLDILKLVRAHVTRAIH